MHRELDSWYSPSLNKHMDIAIYGHYGFALLLIPTAAADYLEYERFLLLDVIQPYIDAGKVKVFSVNSINAESWLHDDMLPHHRALRHASFNQYIEQEVVPYIKSKTSADTPIITSGASLGALHAANLYFRRPDLLDGTIAMSGIYDLTTYTDGYWDDHVYYNSPIHYLPGLNNEYLPQLQQARHIHILAGSGDYENPDASRALAALLNQKGIPHDLDIWGHDMRHDWPTWRSMLPYVLDAKF